MNTLHLRHFIISAMALLIVSLTFAAKETAPANVLEKEQNLVKDVETQNADTQQDAPSSFWDKMSELYHKNDKRSEYEDADLDPNAQTKDVGESDGFWTRIKKAFAYNPPARFLPRLYSLKGLLRFIPSDISLRF